MVSQNIQPTTIPDLSVIVPVYNESTGNLERLIERLGAVLSKTSISFELIFVDDGSDELTAKFVREMPAKYPDIDLKAVILSRNFGEQAAICAGLANSVGRATVNLDSDLQDPPEMIPEMFKCFSDGFEVVYTAQIDRSDSALRLVLTNVYYWLLHKFSPMAIKHAGEFRLLSRRAAQTIIDLPERAVFLRYLIPFVGFKQMTIDFKRGQRTDGQSSYTFTRLLKVGVQGMVASTSAPLVMMPMMALIMCLAIGVTVFFMMMVNPGAINHHIEFLSGWCFAVLNLCCFAVMALYLSVLLTEVRARPKYIVADIIQTRLSKSQPGVSPVHTSHANLVLQHDTNSQ